LPTVVNKKSNKVYVVIAVAVRDGWSDWVVCRDWTTNLWGGTNHLWRWQTAWTVTWSQSNSLSTCQLLTSQLCN